MMPSLRERKTEGEGEGADDAETTQSTSATMTTPPQEGTPDNSSPLTSPRRSGRARRQRVLFGHLKPKAARRLPEEEGEEEEGSGEEEEEGEEEQEQEQGQGQGSESEGGEEESDEEKLDSDLEIPFKAAAPGRGRKRPAPVRKTLPSTKRARKSTTPAGRGPRRRRSQRDDGEASGSLYSIVKAGKAAIQMVVDDWIDSYNKDRETAMVDLIQFFVQCCGCKGSVTGNMLEDGESVNAIRLLTEQFDEDSPEYPLIMTGPVYKKFKTNFCEFIDCLVRQCQHSIVYDDFMLDTLISWLIILSDSQVRAFRHTSTLAGMKLVTSLISIAKNVHVEQDNTQRQLDSENQKAASKRSAEKVEMLQNKRDELRQNICELEEMMMCIFQGMFVQRYRDLRPEIRAICIREIGVWMKEYSTYFLTETYLKYTVWTLHDKVGEVRMQAIQALLGLYEVEDFLSMLETLTSRFKERLLDMTMDKDTEVAVRGIKLAEMLLRYGELDEDDCHQVEQMVFCTNRQVAHAAGSFLCQRIDQTVKQESPSKKRPRRSESDIKKQIIKKFVEFIISCEIHNHSAYFVDSLWETSPLIKDWKLMTEILQDKSGQEDLTDTEEEMLIDMMVASCKQAASGNGPPGRQVKRMTSMKDKKMIADDIKNFSGHFMVVLPGLLSKFGADSRKVINLISLPQYFDLEEYALRRLNKHLEDLLKQLEDVVDKHSDNAVLEECSKTLRKLTDNDLTLKITADVARTKIIDTMVKNFRVALKEGLPEDNEDDDESFPILVNLKRITAFYRAHDLAQWKLYDDLEAIIKCGISKNIPDGIMTNCLISMMLLLVWSLKSLNIGNPNKSEMAVLKKRVGLYVTECDELLHFSSDAVKQQAFLCLSDILVVFAKQLMNTAPLLAPLTYEAESQIQLHCREFLTSRVFADISEDDSQYDDDDDSDGKVEELHNKRLVLAAFCKLITYNIFNMKFAAPVFAQLIRGFANYGDIIKLLMSKCREINRQGYVQAILLSLQQAFESLQEEHDQEIDKLSAEFLAIKDLAHRFALTFGVDTTKQEARHSIVSIHRDGIIYALSKGQDVSVSDSQKGVPPNLLFFEVLNEFTYRLINVDKSGKNGLISYLAKQLHQHKVRDTSGDEWEPLHLYQDGLTGVEREEEEKGTEKSKSLKKGKNQSKGETAKGRTRKKLLLDSTKEDTASKAPSPAARTPSERPTRSKRLREESSGSEGEEERNSADEFDGSLPSASQASWINSQSKQKAVKRTRVSYGKNTTPGSRRSSRLAQEEPEEEIEEFESEGEETPKEKAPAKTREKKTEIPDQLFSDSSQEKPPSDDEGSDLQPAFL